MDIITKRLKLKDIFPKKAKEYARKYHFKSEDDIQLIRKGLTPSDLKVSEGENAIISYITTSTVDRDGEIVDPKGAILSDYSKNRVVLWCHDYTSRNLPLGRNQWIKTDDKGLIAKTEYYVKDDFANKVYNYRKDGFPLAQSIGFIPLKWVDFDDEKSIKENGGARRKYTKWLLLEYSDVPVPSNPDAVAMAISKGLIAKDDITKPETTENYHRVPVPGEEGKHDSHKIRTIDVSKEQGIKGLYCVDCKKIITYLFDKDKWSMEDAKKWVEEHSKELIYIEEKGVIPYKETPKAPIDEEWDAAREVKEADVEDLKIMCAWYDSENPDIKSAYKLPHHKAKGHAVVWRAVAAAMAALLGARGGVNIPDSDRKGVYNHLVKHYKEFDKEPPEFREYDEAELKELFPEDDENNNEPEEEPKTILEFATKYGELLAEKKSLEKQIEDMKQEISLRDTAIKELEDALEAKTGAVLNKKNKANLKNAQNLIQEVLDSAESAEANDDKQAEEIVIEKKDETADDVEVKIEVDEKRLVEIIDKVFEKNVKNNIDDAKETLEIEMKKVQGKVM